MRFFAQTRTAAVLALTAFISLPASPQTPSEQIPALRIETQLVLVDVIAEIKEKSLHTRALLTDLRKQDFRIFDNGHEMPIRSFDIGAHHETRPVALWLIVQCNLGMPPEWASGFLRGKTRVLRPALDGLQKDDTVGVAHWCDDGTASLDLPAGHDPDAALATLDHLINALSIEGHDRAGELAMQKMIRMILDNAQQATPQRLPIFLFLYGDHSGTFVDEANRIIEDVLKTSGIVFGMSDNAYHAGPEQMFRNGKVFSLVHYYGQQTGGQYYSTIDPKLFSAALDYILLQLHLRYTIGFKASVVDEKRHTLRVEITKEAQKRFPGTELRFRKEYVPVPAAPKSQ